MADNQHRYGFRWHKGQYNSVPKGEMYHVRDAYQAVSDAPASVNVDLNIGDPVQLDPAGGGGVTLAIAAASVFGIIVGVHRIYEPSTGYTRPADRVPGGTSGGGNIDRLTYVEVVPAKGVLWEIDVTGVASSPPVSEAGYRALINKNAEHICPGDLSIPGRPKADPMLNIAAAGVATTAAFGWRIVNVSETAHNKDFSGAYVKLIVKVNESQEAGSAATNVPGV